MPPPKNDTDIVGGLTKVTPLLAPLQGAGGASVQRFNLRTPAGAIHEKRGQAQFGKTSSLIPDLRGMASKVCVWTQVHL